MKATTSVDKTSITHDLAATGDTNGDGNPVQDKDARTGKKTGKPESELRAFFVVPFRVCLQVNFCVIPAREHPLVKTRRGSRNLSHLSCLCGRDCRAALAMARRVRARERRQKDCARMR